MSTDLIQINKAELAEKYERLKGHIATVKKHAELAMGRAMSGGEVVVAAAAVPYLIAKGTLPATIAGYDTELALGVGLAAAGLLGLAGEHSNHVYFLGIGAAAAFAAKEGAAKGAQH